MHSSYPFPYCLGSRTHLAPETRSSAFLSHHYSPENPSLRCSPQVEPLQGHQGFPRPPAGREIGTAAGAEPESSPACPEVPNLWTCLTPESHLACYCVELQ